MFVMLSVIMKLKGNCSCNQLPWHIMGPRVVQGNVCSYNS